MTDKERLRAAAQIMSEFFTDAVLGRMRELRSTDVHLTHNEQAALDWLREQTASDAETTTCHWAGSFMRHGPPPWRDKT